MVCWFNDIHRSLLAGAYGTNFKRVLFLILIKFWIQKELVSRVTMAFVLDTCIPVVSRRLES